MDRTSECTFEYCCENFKTRYAEKEKVFYVLSDFARLGYEFHPVLPLPLSFRRVMIAGELCDRGVTIPIAIHVTRDVTRIVYVYGDTPEKRKENTRYLLEELNGAVRFNKRGLGGARIVRIKGLIAVCFVLLAFVLAITLSVVSLFTYGLNLIPFAVIAICVCGIVYTWSHKLKLVCTMFPLKRRK